MSEIDPYNPLELEALGQALLRELERHPLHPLAGLPRFEGSGIYALYYCGGEDPYAAMGRFNLEHNCRIPIYIGRAKETGARQGLNPFQPVTSPLLWDRVQEHKKSIDHATNLDVEEFAVRVLVVMPIWIPLAEAMAIRIYRPLWNSHLQGFGIHAPGGGRAGQKRSQWDELHPGRRFAAGLKRNESTVRADLVERMRRATQEAVAQASRPASEDTRESTPQPPPPTSPGRRSRSASSPRPRRP